MFSGWWMVTGPGVRLPRWQLRLRQSPCLARAYASNVRQIGNRLFSELGMAHSGLRKGRRDGPDSVAIFRPKSLCFKWDSDQKLFLGRLDGLTGRSARTRDFVRLGKKVLGGSRETGGWAKAAGVGAAGGALEQRDAKRGMNSCDVLLCILSVSCRGGRRVSNWREVARIGA